MAEPNITPEEKLLRIIESPPEVARGMRRERRGGQDYKLLFKLLKAKYAGRLKSFLNLRAVNGILILCAATLTLYLVADFALGMPRAAQVERLELQAKRMDIGDLSLGQLDPLPDYLHEITQRNIFALSEPPPAVETPAVKAPEPSAQAKSLTDELKLVGIIWSAAPQAILEDTKDGRTHLLNRGGTVKGARVKEILKDRVILSYDGQEVELI